MFSKILSAFVAGLALASAYTTPVGDPSGNPISKPGLNEIVPVNQPYTITWNPTTPGTVSILLLRGPSTNVVPIATLVEGAPNTGTYSWTPSTDLDDDVTHYGLQLIVDGTGQYQYSTQFGISNPTKAGSSGSSSMSGSMTMSMSMSTSTSAYANRTSHTMTMSSSSSASGYPISNTTIVTPTVPMTVPSTLVSSPTGTSSARPQASQTTNAGAKAVASFGGAAVALFAAVAAL